jgi:hypothetical protein
MKILTLTLTDFTKGPELVGPEVDLDYANRLPAPRLLWMTYLSSTLVFIVSIHYFFDITLDLALSFAQTSAAYAIQSTLIGGPHPRPVVTLLRFDSSWRLLLGEARQPCFGLRKNGSSHGLRSLGPFVSKLFSSA